MLGSIKTAITSAVVTIKSAIPAILASSSIITLLGGFIYYFTIKDGIYEENPANVRYSLEQYLSQITIDSIVSNGKGGYAYSVNLDETVDEIVKKLKEANSNIHEYTGILKEKDIIEKLIRAEIISQYPDLRSQEEIKNNKKIRSNELQGGIKIIAKDSRKSTSGSDLTKLEYNISNEDKILTYIPYEQFKRKIDAKDGDVKNHFTLKASGGDTNAVDIIVAGWTNEKTTVKTVEYMPNDDDSNETKTENQKVTENNVSFHEVSINYQNMLSKYAMPSGFLWSILVMGEKVSFVEKLADLAIENTEIVIELHDNIVTTYNTSVQSYKYRKDIKKVTKNSSGQPTTVNSSIIANNESSITTTIETRQSNTYLDLTFAETWVAIYKKDYQNTVNSDSGYKDDWLNNAEWTNLEKETVSTNTTVSSDGQETKTVVTQKTENKIANNFQTYNTNLYNSAGTIVQERTEFDEKDNFITYFNKSGRVKEYILQSPDWFFEMLESHEKTANMLDLVKYLLYKATNNDYGVTSYNFEPYSNLVSASQSSLEQYVKFMHSWEGIPPQEGDSYLVFDDGYGNLTIGWGICFYSKVDGYMKKEAFNKIGYDVTKLKVGDKILKTDIDNIEKQIVQNNITRVNGITNGLNLTQYQKYALVDRMYQSGGISGFVDAYNQYWQEGEEKLGEDTSAEDYSHGLARWFIGTSTGGVKNRRKAQWLIFKYGYYNRIDEYYSLQGYNSDFSYGISLYDIDGRVSQTGINQLEEHLTKNVLHTTIHKKNYVNQQGPFEKWWQSPENYLEKFQCTWWANGRASQYLELTGIMPNGYPTESGNGGEYYSINRQNGWFNYGSEAKANSIISWSYGDWGHVAYVEAVDTNGDIYVSHAGGGWSWYGIQKLTKNNNYLLEGTPCNGFIYLDEPKK